MAKIPKAGRNDLCACGSGKKFKKCHGLRNERRSPVATAVAVLVGGMVLAAVVFGFSAYGRDEGSAAPAAGRTWSPEHGHWH
jgi:hypothetical protein